MHFSATSGLRRLRRRVQQPSFARSNPNPTNLNAKFRRNPLSPAMQFVEYTIPLPFGGHPAAKWWGGPRHRRHRPIVLLHGWQDNCGSFDRLVPLLPPGHSYLAIDLPGHGRSSPHPPGIIYSRMQFLYTLNYVFREHFRWPRVSYIAHSFGAQLMFIYASTFPGYIDLAVSLDALAPKQQRYENDVRTFLRNFAGSVLRTDMRIVRDIEPPAYRYEELVRRQLQATQGSVSRATVPTMLERGSKASRQQADRWCFSRDNRLKYVEPIRLTHEQMLELAAEVRCPFLLVKARQSQYDEDMEEFGRIAAVMEAANAGFEYYAVDGDHHVHLTEPERLAGKVAEFIGRYRAIGGSEEVSVSVSSKL